MEDLTARVEEALAKLAELPAALEKAALALALGKLLEKAPRDLLRQTLRLLVSRVDLFFEPDPKKNGKVWFRFVKGAVKFRPMLEFKGSEGCQGSHPPINPSGIPRPLVAV